MAALAEEVLAIARSADEAIMTVYREGDPGVTVKGDDSPLTRADIAAHAVIDRRLKELTPLWPVLSEEANIPPYEARKTWGRFWMVDPLDGTKEFIRRRDQFTVNIALIEEGRPILGVVTAPALGTGWWGAVGVGAFAETAAGRKPIRAGGYAPGETLKIVASRSHATPEQERFIGALDAAVESVNIGSSLKLCLVAEGSAHIYPRLGPTMEWDTAAAHAVVEQAGGIVTDLTGAPLAYNKPEPRNPFFIVTGAPPFDWRAAAAAVTGRR